MKTPPKTDAAPQLVHVDHAATVNGVLIPAGAYLTQPPQPPRVPPGAGTWCDHGDRWEPLDDAARACVPPADAA